MQAEADKSNTISDSYEETYDQETVSYDFYLIPPAHSFLKFNNALSL